MPLKQLAGFARVSLAPGQERRVSLTLSPMQAFAYYDESAQGLRVEPGEYEVQVGASSRDVRLKSRIRVQ
jgi:beta-glucosidase